MTRLEQFWGRSRFGPPGYLLRSQVFWWLVQFCSYPHRWRIYPLEFLRCAALHDQQPSLIYSLIRVQEPTHPAMIKLHMLVLQPCAHGHSPRNSICLSCMLDSAHTQLCLYCFFHPSKNKCNLLVCMLQELCQEQREVQIFALGCYSFHSGDKWQASAQSFGAECRVSTELAPASQPHQDETPTINSWVLTWGKRMEGDWNMAFKKKKKNFEKITRLSLCEIRSVWSLCAVSHRQHFHREL